MTNQEILKDYLSLIYKKDSRQEKCDIKIKDYIILRSTGMGDTIHYLTSGLSLFLPWSWISIFKGLFYYSGDQILYSGESIDTIEEFIRLSVILQSYPLGQVSKVNGDKFLDTLGDLCNIGTGEFREYMLKTYDIKVEPFEYDSLKKKIII
jgi:hypothetical protein